MKRTIFILLAAVFAVAFALPTLADGSEISYGKGYTLITPASAAYPDDSKKLTDGIFGSLPDGSSSYYASGAYVGFNQVDVDDDGNFVIILDLGKEYSDISAVTIGFLNETSAGIYAPKSVGFALSNDRNGEYSELGRLDTAKPTASGLSETFAMTLATEDAIGRYLRVTIEHLGEFTDENGEIKTAGWTFIDEISVYSSGNAEGSESIEESSNAVGEQSSPTESGDEISENDTSEPLAESSTPEIPDAGDGGIMAFVLLALSSLAMIGALFTSRKMSNRI